MMDRITRRELLRRSAAGGAAFSLPALVAACGGDGGGIEGQNQTTAEQAAEQQDTTLAKTLTISNWPLYIDVEEKTKKRPTIEDFQRETGVRVRYIEDVNDNDEWFGKFQAQLSNGEPIGRDIVVLTDWMAARMVKLGYVEKKNKDAIPNESNLVEALRNPGWDPEREFSLPWQSGLTGIAYNPKMTGGNVDTIEQLFTDPKLKGKVTALTEMPDTMGLVMLANGDDPTNVDAEAFDRGIETLQQAVDSGQIRRFTGNDYAPLLAKGEIAACIAWSGDIVQLQFDNPGLEFVIPEDGGMIWTDNMLIPQGGDVYTASTFMNFVYQPAIAAQIEAWVNYICPVQGAKEELEKEDPELARNELIFPSEETLAQVKIFDAEAADNQEFKEKFATVTGA
ncbi:MAG: spermidine/putrescine ABC transporter substrate-binding protein [Actinobacteria bacterium]|nr:spermidine/putrescine ABC transporter substrate-binding protein [Actinomycetota bacterium]